MKSVEMTGIPSGGSVIGLHGPLGEKRPSKPFIVLRGRRSSVLADAGSPDACGLTGNAK
jgi:hypothetical protein